MGSVRCRKRSRTNLDRVLDLQGRKTTWVARRLGVSHVTVIRWRSGERPIPDFRLRELAELLGVTVPELAGKPAVQEGRRGRP